MAAYYAIGDRPYVQYEIMNPLCRSQSRLVPIPPLRKNPNHRHQLVHREDANAATNDMTQDAHLKIVRTTRSSNNKIQHAIGWAYICIAVNGHQ